MMKADSLNSESVIDNGIVNPAAAASGWGEVKLGLEERYVFSGFAYCVYISMHYNPRTSDGFREDANPCLSNFNYSCDSSTTAGSS
jgi:hypothetical protein